MIEYEYAFGAFLGVLGGIVCLLCALRPAAILQQCGYSCRAFLKWYFRKGNIQRKRISLFFLALVLLGALFSVCFSFLPYDWTNLICALPCLGISALYFYAERKYALKVKMKPTARLIRLLSALGLLCVGLSALLGAGLVRLSLIFEKDWLYDFRFLPLTFLPLILPFLLSLANLIMSLYEIPHNRRYIKRAKRALSKSKCVKVGVTGSFGKTSVKSFAAQMLSRKFRTIATPSSFNTPMGIAKTVLEGGLDCDIFLAEMGARRTGDISELCDLVSPKIGVVTGVCAQHIETFGSLEAVKREKEVLAKRTEQTVLGKTVSDFSARKALREGEDFEILDLSCGTEGSSFTLRLGKERIFLKTSLLGRSAAEDVALAAALCFVLGMSLEEIALAAHGLEPVPHRLEKLEEGGVTILDDSYNSNAEGAKNAVETLRLFGGRKFVVTPGLVELGEISEEVNAALGANLTGLEVILVGETLVLPIRKGYLEAGGKEENLKIVPTLDRAQELLREELRAGDCVLFLNDLPDIYS